MSTRMLAILAWTMWGVLMVALVVAMVMVATERQRAPEVSRGLGPLVVGLLLLLVASAGGLLYWLGYKQYQTGLLAMTVLLFMPLFVMVARPGVLAFKSWSLARDEARIGDFDDPGLSAMAEAIQAGDAAELERLLRTRPSPVGRDRAGNDLLAFALSEVRDRQGNIVCVRALLEAGVDPRASRTSENQDPLNFMLPDWSPTGRAAILLLLQHGADANAVDPVTGATPIRAAGHDPDLVRALVEAGAAIDHVQPDGLTALVEFVGLQQWESAIYLVEQGADLDARDSAGVSVDYYLGALQHGADGGPPDGAVRLKALIARRRLAPPGSGSGELGHGAQ